MEPVKALLFDVFGTVVDWRSGVIRDVTALAAEQRGRHRRGAVRGPLAGGLPPGHEPGPDGGAALDQPGRPAPPHAGPAARAEPGWRAWTRPGGPGSPPAGTGSTPGPMRCPAWSASRSATSSPLSLTGTWPCWSTWPSGAGLPWDFVFSAELFGHYKPDPQTYLGAVGAAQPGPGRGRCWWPRTTTTCMAAGDLGLATAFVPRPGDLGPNHQANREPARPYTCVAADFADLAGLLGA